MGKKKYIETPEKLWQLFKDYEKDTKANPILIHEFKGKDASSVYREVQRPLTMVGFEDYVCEHTKVSYPDLTSYFDKSNESYANYFPISSRIKARIEKDQIEGGMAMIYSQSITARLNGLVDKQEVKEIKEKPLLDAVRQNNKPK